MPRFSLVVGHFLHAKTLCPWMLLEIRGKKINPVFGRHPNLSSRGKRGPPIYWGILCPLEKDDTPKEIRAIPSNF